MSNFFEGTPESGQGVRISEVESVFDFRMAFCDTLSFREVIVSNVKKKSEKNTFSTITSRKQSVLQNVVRK